MPRYFFDISNERESLRDAYGIDLADLSEAIEQAEEVAKTLILEGVVRSGSMDVVVRVRSAAGDVVHVVGGNITSRSTTAFSSPLSSLDAC